MNYKMSCVKMKKMPICAVLDNIRSLHNVGSIFRTSDGAGISKIYLCGITGKPPRKEIAKTSLGAEKHIEWEWKKSTLRTVKFLKKQGWKIIALELTKKSAPYSDVEYEFPLALVIGNEVAGIAKEILREADKIIYIPMRGEKESLNVSVAYGVAAYGIISSRKLDSRQRKNIIKK